MYAVMRDLPSLPDAVRLFWFEGTARDWQAENGGEVVALSESAERRIVTALRESEELSATLRTGINRRTRGTK